MSNLPEFPLPVRRNGRLYWLRSELEVYKRALVRAARGLPDAAAPSHSIEEFVPSDQVAKEFGINRRTLGRRIAGRDVKEAA
jgi:hypothetical protein